MLTEAQKAILAAPPELGQQEQEIINQLHTDPRWREARLQEARGWLGEPTARFLTTVEVALFLLRLPLRAEAFIYLRDTTEVIAGLTGKGGGGWSQGTRILQFNGTQFEAWIHESAHVFIGDYLRQDEGIASAFMEALKDWGDLWYAPWAFWWSKERRRVWNLVQGYVYGRWEPGLPGASGNPPDAAVRFTDQGWQYCWPGFYKDGAWKKQDAEEAYASLASGIMGHLALLPGSMRAFYGGMFR